MRIVLVCGICAGVLFLLSCSNGGWLDDGSRYLCADCAGKTASELAPCEICVANSTPYRLCYNCARELEQCQSCRRVR